uniref:Uncharacterized protein LOC110201110 isoform X2 n=1 Tax=Phascolarctos cinereus TaxID=38626 RepID=A0A6P5JDC2_PHACI|nr:uncharacterized protein LOC110201110 isoform X2 [Phascolarctos cinereus]
MTTSLCTYPTPQRTRFHGQQEFSGTAHSQTAFLLERSCLCYYSKLPLSFTALNTNAHWGLPVHPGQSSVTTDVTLQGNGWMPCESGIPVMGQVKKGQGQEYPWEGTLDFLHVAPRPQMLGLVGLQEHPASPRISSSLEISSWLRQIDSAFMLATSSAPSGVETEVAGG